ncbi:hypothetical protein MC28_G405 (plasmid) [Bacillus thuringiensis MC28]|nr:hypothetical protein MC28_G405 [Bacillus thuringiensis MC28]
MCFNIIYFTIFVIYGTVLRDVSTWGFWGDRVSFFYQFL